MAQIPILNGIYADAVADFRTSYPRNMVPVPKQTGIAAGYLRPGEGLEEFAAGPGIDRGGFNWNGTLIRVMGTKLVSVSAAGAVTELGDVGNGGRVTIQNQADYLSIWSGGRLYYWDGATLTQVTDPDLGTVIDGCCIGGYNLSTDGTYLIVTDLADRTAVNPLRYGSAETDPDPIRAVRKHTNQAYAFGRYTVEVFANVAGTGFPFERIDGAQVERGTLGAHTVCKFADSFAFLGSGRDEPPAVWAMAAGSTSKISTREIDEQLLRYTETDLSECLVEARMSKGHNWLLLHLPSETWVYDAAASQAVGEPIWFSLDSGLLTRSAYRAQGLTWCYDRWIAADPLQARLGTFSDAVSSHYGQAIGWDFGTMVLYNEGSGAIVNDLELVALTGRVALGADPTIWTSYSEDGETWSQERPISAGKQGQRLKRLCWRKQGQMRHYRVQRFRGTSDAHLSFARLEAQLEPLNG